MIYYYIFEYHSLSLNSKGLEEGWELMARMRLLMIMKYHVIMKLTEYKRDDYSSAFSVGFSCFS